MGRRHARNGDVGDDFAVHLRSAGQKTKKAIPILKNGKPVMVKQRKWLMTMAPVDQVGQGGGRR